MARSLASTIHQANAALMIEGDTDLISTFFAPSYIVHLTNQDMKGGYAAIRKVVALYRHAFSGIQVDVEILVQAQGRVAWQRTVRAKHTGPFKGFLPTGRRLIWRDMVTSRFRSGRIAEDWLLTDLAERLLLARRVT